MLSNAFPIGDLNPTATARPLIVVPPPAISDPDVVVPPTPTKQLLPLSETDGLTSGAVQPPGSTGEESRSDYVVSSEPGEESDGSYSDDEVFTAALRAEELEDEEQRLIKQGGTGIPIGPVSPFHTSRLQTLPDLPAGWKTEAFATSHNPKI